MQYPNQELEKLIDKYLKGEANSEEIDVVERFFDSFSSRPNLIKTLPDHVQKALKARIHGRIIKKLTRRNQKTFNFPRIAAAAAILCIAFTSLYLYKIAQPNNREITLTNGQQQRIVLEDGTKVTLNASSKIIYPASFKDSSTREVTLIGEAFFDVAKNPSKPFLIHTPRMEISVLGTAFNVRDYAEENNAQTALVRGKVSIWKKGPDNQKFILKPKEKFVIRKVYGVEKEFPSTTTKTASAPMAIAIQPFSISESDGSALETEWLLNRITIQDDRLLDIALKLERMYGVEIKITNKAVANQRYSATFENEQLENILKALQTVNYFQIKKTGKNQIQLL
ncbi:MULTISPECIES: FecR family protein [Sphingobacterium]|jgi:ferric-dicitrate binding protein FerR (iron transport regulator)|uniref:FecR family protein n=1 Tax=Sphingobacterium TaxID=28453 RepID=UPI002580E923|nr:MULTISPECIES: FecR domain-containing protein [Sphingobacterium]